MKVTVLIVIIFVITLLGCQQFDRVDEQIIFQQKIDSIASKQIDSAYKKIAAECDSIVKTKVPTLVDSLLLQDTMNIKLAMPLQ